MDFGRATINNIFDETGSQCVSQPMIKCRRIFRAEVEWYCVNWIIVLFCSFFFFGAFNCNLFLLSYFRFLPVFIHFLSILFFCPLFSYLSLLAVFYSVLLLFSYLPIFWWVFLSLNWNSSLFWLISFFFHPFSYLPLSWVIFNPA